MPRKQVKDAIDELHDVHSRTTEGIRAGILRLAEAVAGGNDGRPEAAALRRSILQAMQFADMLGRRRVLLEFDAARDVSLPAKRALPDNIQAALGAEGPPFQQMITDLIARQPRLASDAAHVARIYAEDHAFAAVYSPSIQVTEAVQNAVSRLQREGVPTIEARDVLVEMTDWADWYAETVFRTNVTTAYAAGRWQQVSKPEVREVVPAFRYTAVGDKDTRPNHAAADGLIAGLDDPIWERFTPPLGYNCRCTIELVDRFELERLGLLLPNGRVKRFTPPGFTKAAPDSNRFGNGRPDRRLYGF